MKKALFLILLLGCLTQVFSYEWIELENVEEYRDIQVDEYSLTIFERVFTVEEWWKEQPALKLIYKGPGEYRELVSHLFEELGFVLLEEGRELEIDITQPGEDLLLVKVFYNGRYYDNAKNLFKTGEFEKALTSFLKQFLEDHTRRLPTLVLVKSGNEIQSSAERLYYGPGYSVFRTFDREMILKSGEERLTVQVPFRPVAFLDLEEAIRRLRITADFSIDVTVDGQTYKTPADIEVEPGVHELQYGAVSRYLYIEEDTEIQLDADSIGAVLTVQTSDNALMSLYRQGEDTPLMVEEGSDVTFELPEGKYSVRLNAEGFSEKTRDVQLKAGEDITLNVKLTGEPGKLFKRIELNATYNSLFFTDDLLIITRPGGSIIVDLETGEKKVLQEEVTGVSDDYFLTNSRIYDASRTVVFESTVPLAGIIQTGQMLWIFQSDRHLKGMRRFDREVIWTRIIDYLPVRHIETDGYIVVIDLYSRVIFLDGRRGYSELTRERVPDIKELTNHEIDDHKVSVLLPGPGKRYEYYFRTRKQLITPEEVSTEESELVYKAGTVLQKGSALLSIAQKPCDMKTKNGLVAVLTKDECRILYGY